MDDIVKQLRERAARKLADEANRSASLFGRAADEIERLMAFEKELKLLVDRLGHDGGAVCGWGTKKPTATEWADAVFSAAQDNEEYARTKTPND